MQLVDETSSSEKITVTLRLLKEKIDHRIDAYTDKRNDATSGYSEVLEANERVANAVSSDVTEDNDGFLITHYRDRRDALLRKALKYCLVDDAIYDGMVIDNFSDSGKWYLYKLSLPADGGYTASDLSAVANIMEDYIVRGTLFDWYLNVGLQPTDTAESLDSLLEEVASSFRGKPYGRRPLQPFGPAEYPRREY